MDTKLRARKSLGQHWLLDKEALGNIANAAKLSQKDTVLEVGPGLGTLTQLLVQKAGKVIAVELDHNLAAQLTQKIVAPNLKVKEGDILKFELTKLPRGYKVVANIPYYLTSHLLRILSESANPPALMVLLIQKEVAQRVAAMPGRMSLLSVSVQLHYDIKLGQTLPAHFFKPPPKVDSQVMVLNRRPKPLFTGLDDKEFFRDVQAGFANLHKKLRSSLSAGLHISKEAADDLLESADINGDLRAESLNLQQWHRLYTQVQVKKDLRSLLSK